MKLTYTIDKESKTVFVKAKGEITVNDLIENEKKVIEDPDFEIGFNTLADFTYAKPSASVNFNMISLSSDFVKSIQGKRGKCRWAFIAPHDPTYGVCRMFSMLWNGLNIESSVFRTEDEAKKWLGLE